MMCAHRGGCPTEYWFVKQIPLREWRVRFRRDGRVFIVFAVSAADNPRMAEHVYKKIEIVGSSPNGREEAVHNALSRASKTIRNMRWFEVTETRGYIDDGKIEHWQVTLKIGFTLEE
jgi:flavin-binding protein dodecin